jgi:enediyne biosynthesis protein E4
MKRIWILAAWALPLWGQGFEETTDRASLHDRISTGIAWADFDEDGHLDMYVTKTAPAVGGGAAPLNILYHNQGDGTFADVTDFTAFSTSSPGGQNSRAAVWGDYDRDGDLDLFVANGAGDYLFSNRGLQTSDRSFSWVDRINERINDIGQPIGIERTFRSTSAAWGDYDNDGDLDLYVGKNNLENLLYQNNDVHRQDDLRSLFSLDSSLDTGDWRDTENVTWIDYDIDGDLDLYVVNREQRNSLYRNDGSGLEFIEVACAITVANREIGRAAAWGDFDNDGDPDLYLANVGANALYRNEGADLFVDIATSAGVRQIQSDWLTSDAAWADYDGDGWLDLYLANGGMEQSQVDHLLGNNGDATFSDVTNLAGLPTAPSSHTAVAWGDYDGDGTPDLYLADGTADQGDRLFRNNAPTESFMTVQLLSRSTLSVVPGEVRLLIGTRVRLLRQSTGQLLASRQTFPRAGGLELIFGTPSVAGPYSLQVFFPGRDEAQMVEGVEAGAGLIQVFEDPSE